MDKSKVLKNIADKVIEEHLQYMKIGDVKLFCRYLVETLEELPVKKLTVEETRRIEKFYEER